MIFMNILFFILPKEWKNNRIILHFGAVDYECIIYINKCYAASHVGGNTSFSVDITDYLSKMETRYKD